MDSEENYQRHNRLEADRNAGTDTPSRDMTEPEYRENQRQKRMATASAMVGKMDADMANQFLQAMSSGLNHKNQEREKELRAQTPQHGPSREYFMGRNPQVPSPATVAPALPIPMTLNDLDNEVASLFSAVQELENRLRPVLSNASADGIGGGASPSPTLVVERISSNLYTIRGLYAQVKGIIDRLHL